MQRARGGGRAGRGQPAPARAFGYIRRLMSSSTPASALPLGRVLACGAAIVALSLGVRHGFGLWLQPMTQDMGWTRQDFALAIAVQNLLWGVAGIFIGMVADRFGAFRVLIAGALLYAAGLAGMAWAPTPLALLLTAGVLIGVAQAGTTYSVVYGVLGRNVPAARRSWAMGLSAAAGSFGQFAILPADRWLIDTLGWAQALGVLAAAVLLIVPLAFGLRERGSGTLGVIHQDQSIGQALREALRHRPFVLLTLGYFVCGFQVVFIGVHLPAYLRDHGLSPQVASTALALIGLFNIFGTYAVGVLGQRLPKARILAMLYTLRTVFVTVFLLAPLSPWSVYLFAAAMGLLWLSTVPATNAVIAQIFGVAHLSMLGGVAFFSHQIGSFLGVWLGGLLYDLSGNYDIVWGMTLVLGVLAAALNWPIDESPIRRASARPQAA